MADYFESTVKVLKEELNTINPFIYGNFIEFIADCINPCLWAQLLVNRSFENEDKNEDGVSDPWNLTGYNDTVVYSVDTGEYAFNGKSQKIEVIEHYGGYAGISQKDLRLNKGESYSGRIWMKTQNFSGSVQVRIYSEDNRLDYCKEFAKVESKWKEYDFCVKSDDDTNAIIEIRVLGEGIVWVDNMALSPGSAIDGVWKNVLNATKDMKCGIMRFPGGCFADSYDWRDGISVREQRPVVENIHWKGFEDNSFGTDEFIKFCRNTDCEPLICINFGSGTPELAAQWVEYCNGDESTEYGKLRIANGNTQPFNVKYWEIGNETFGDWEIGHCTAEEFADRYLAFYDAMKKADPDIKIIACGGNGNEYSQDWNKALLAKLKGRLDYVSLHFYAPQQKLETYDDRDKLYYGIAGAPVKYEKVIRDTASSISEAGNEEVKIAVTEWNTMHVNSSYRERTMEAAIFNAGLLNTFIRTGTDVEIGTYSDLVNGWQGGCIVNSYDRVFLTPSYYVLKMYAGSNSKCLLKTETQSPTYDIECVGHVKDIKNVPYIDCIACKSDEGINLFVINRDKDREALINIHIMDSEITPEIKVTTIKGKPYDINSLRQETVKMEETMVSNIYNGLLVKPCSIQLLKITYA